MKVRKIRASALLAVAGLSLGCSLPARACFLDSVPSISANGALAQLNTKRPTFGNLAHWAVFVFPTGFPAGQRVRFAEDRAELHRSLQPAEFGRPWRWRFGDGAQGSGDSVAHSYGKAGDYKVIVYAYYPSSHAWYEFDEALLHVR